MRHQEFYQLHFISGESQQAVRNQFLIVRDTPRREIPEGSFDQEGVSKAVNRFQCVFPCIYGAVVQKPEHE